MNLAIDVNDVIRDNMYQFRKVYQQYIDNVFDIDLNDIDTTDMLNHYPGFKDISELNQFRCEDFTQQLYAHAELCDPKIKMLWSGWVWRDLMCLDDDVNVIVFSPFETPKIIQATLYFLSKNEVHARNYYFPVDSFTIYDMADVVITAQPSLIENCPENKTVVKINKPYNKELETKYSFDSLTDIMTDQKETVIKLLEQYA